MTTENDPKPETEAASPAREGAGLFLAVAAILDAQGRKDLADRIMAYAPGGEG